MEAGRACELLWMMGDMNVTIDGRMHVGHEFWSIGWDCIDTVERKS